MELRFEVQAKIKKPVSEVFDGVYNPKKLSLYFANAGASGALDEGKSVLWKFAEFPGPFPVHVKKVITNEKIVLEWANTKASKTLWVEMSFEPRQTLDPRQDQGIWLEQGEPGIPR